MGISTIGGGTAAGGGTLKERSFVGSGTWTVPDGVESVEATIVGASGGVGDSNRRGCGAGGYWKGVIPVTPGATMSVTVGAGTSSTNTGGFSEFGPIRALGSNPSENGATGAVVQADTTPGILGGGIIDKTAVVASASSTDYDTNRMPMTAGAYTIWVGDSVQSNKSRSTRLWDGPNQRFLTLTLDNVSLGPAMYGQRFYYFEQTAPNHLFFWNAYGAAYQTWGAVSIADINAAADGGTVTMYGATASGFYLPEVSEQPSVPLSFREFDGKLWLFYRDNVDGIWYSSDITVQNNWSQITNTDLGVTTSEFPYAIEVDDTGAWWALCTTHYSTSDTYYMSVSYDNGATWTANNSSFNNPGVGDYNYYYPGHHPQHQFRYLNSRTAGSNTYQRFLVYTGYSANNNNYFFHKVNIIEWYYNTASPSTPVYFTQTGDYINGLSGLGTSSDNTTANGYRQWARTDVVNGRTLLSMTHHEIGAIVDLTDALPVQGAAVAFSASNAKVKTYIDDDGANLYQIATWPDPVNNYVYHSAYSTNTDIKVSKLFEYSKPAIKGSWNTNVPATSGAGGPGVSMPSTTYGYSTPGAPAPDGFAGGSAYNGGSYTENLSPGWGMSHNAATTAISANGIVVLRWSE